MASTVIDSGYAMILFFLEIPSLLKIFFLGNKPMIGVNLLFSSSTLGLVS